jgi:diacylglycerol kinase family enzyme
MRWLAILNPRAGHHPPDYWRRLRREVRRRLGADCTWTCYPKHAAEIVRQHPGYDGFIAVGGDGTIAEVVDALDCETHCLGVIPAGTGNGLARDLQLPSPGVALRALCRPQVDRLDLISVRYRAHRSWSRRRMLMTSALGYVAGTTRLGALPFKRLGAWYNLVPPVVQCFLQEEFTARLRLDGGPWQEFTLTTLVVHNSQYIGQFRLFPGASLADGRLDLLYGKLAPLGQLLEGLAVLTRTYPFQRSTRRQGQEVEVELPRPGTLMIDGDLIPGVDAIHYRVAPGQLRCCTGPGVRSQGSARRGADS